MIKNCLNSSRLAYFPYRSFRFIHFSKINFSASFVYTQERMKKVKVLEILSKADHIEIANNSDLSDALSKQYEATKTDNEFKRNTQFCKEMMESRLKNLQEHSFSELTQSDFDF